jgi:hypothetical protein
MVHRTGSDNATAASIDNGRPDLPGPLSQLHLARDGTVIGIECANSGTSPTATHCENWPEAQDFAMVRCCAATAS